MRNGHERPRGYDELIELARTLLGGYEADTDLWEANQAVNDALRLKPGSAEAWLLKCQILSALEDDPAALAAAEMALRRAPRRAESHYFRASVLADMGRYDDALRTIERAFRWLGTGEEWLVEDLFYEKAAILSALGRTEEALATYKTGLERCPQSHILKAALEPMQRERVRQRLRVLEGGRR